MSKGETDDNQTIEVVGIQKQDEEEERLEVVTEEQKNQEQEPQDVVEEEEEEEVSADNANGPHWLRYKQ